MTPYNSTGHRAALLAGLIILTLSGCGPGFPLMTKAQEDQNATVEKLVKDNETLNKRVAALEGTGGANKDIDALRRAVAGISSEIEALRQEFSFVQGSMETGSHDKTQTKESIKSLNAASTAVNAKISTLETVVKDAVKSMSDLKASVDANEKLLREMQDELDIIRAQKEGPAKNTTANLPADDKTGSAVGPDDLYAKGLKELKAKEYDKSIETLKSFLATHPDHKLAGNAQYWLGEDYYAKGDFEQAALEFDKAVKKYPKSDKAPAAMLKEGFSFDKLGMKNESRVVLEELMEKHPKSQEAKKAKEKLVKKK